ncbi:hypothetical protein UA75_29605 [Actinoalloteichus sp. GBA129-24]|uniref:Uncharacterized protein n=1 Tax=Actinoalloteichus fjordicus TaxID=1612552 RepID=A0AAC9LJI0_9PSEU|nr:hypothetical protein UA74_29075 [Actinoalloteichus fjordicus]APU23885.1 hypothetical protein UA75_29605 [Actinoalloteichus sp. GBA129-24]
MDEVDGAGAAARSPGAVRSPADRPAGRRRNREPRRSKRAAARVRAVVDEAAAAAAAGSAVAEGPAVAAASALRRSAGAAVPMVARPDRTRAPPARALACGRTRPDDRARVPGDRPGAASSALRSAAPAPVIPERIAASEAVRLARWARGASAAVRNPGPGCAPPTPSRRRGPARRGALGAGRRVGRAGRTPSCRRDRRWNACDVRSAARCIGGGVPHRLRRPRRAMRSIGAGGNRRHDNRPAPDLLPRERAHCSARRAASIWSDTWGDCQAARLGD